MAPPARGGRFWFVAVALVLLVAAIYGQTVGHEFVNLDDDHYVYDNPAVRGGLTPGGVARAFGFMSSNWHPLTWISHMLDVQIFGMWPGGHHAVSVALHAANAVLLFAALHAMTGALWRSAAVAAVFAVHPLGAESVAWVAERKNLLCTLFLWLTCGAWLRWVRRPSPSRYAAALAFAALGLAAKPMLVTLPVLLLLLDWWPLGRLRTGKGDSTGAHMPLPRLLAEKVPFLAMAATTGLLTVAAQTVAIKNVAFTTRLANALVSFARYLADMVWPSGLAVFYPYPVRGIPPYQIALSLLLLAAITTFAAAQRNRRPYLATGWCWYLVALLPVIGLVQVGIQARADRYTYIPLVGVFIALVWLGREILPESRAMRQGLGVAALAGLVVLSVAAFRQAARWRDTITLLGYTARATKDNHLILNNLGIALLDANRVEDAQRALEESVRIKPDDGKVIYNLGNVFFKKGRWQEAGDLYRRALRNGFDRPDTHISLGICLFSLGRYAEAAESFRAARVNPAYRNVGMRLNMALSMLRKEAGSGGAPAP